MITPAELKTKAGNLYPKYVKSWLVDQKMPDGGGHERPSYGSSDFFPKRIPANLKIPANHASAALAVQQLREKSKSACGSGYSVEWQSQKRRDHGLNEYPVAIFVETESDLLELAGKRSEFSELQKSVKNLRSRLPRLEDWLVESTNWKQLVGAKNQLDDLILVTEYFLQHPRPNCFARELPLQVSTKLVEENRKLISQWLDRLLPPEHIDVRYSQAEFEPRYGLKAVRHHLMLRFLDDSVRQEVGLQFNELSLPVDSLDRLPITNVRVFIVENKVNLLTLPSHSRGIALGGLGRAVSLLREVSWLAQESIFYWGDFDVEGFEMLSQIRSIFPQTKSLLMDQQTFEDFSHLAIQWPNRLRSTPHFLTSAEEKLFQHLLSNKLRLEQERITQAWVTQVLGGLKDIR